VSRLPGNSAERTGLAARIKHDGFRIPSRFSGGAADYARQKRFREELEDDGRAFALPETGKKR
jgi:hypothetical protein